MSKKKKQTRNHIFPQSSGKKSITEQHQSKSFNFLKKYTDEIQSICSIISVLILGVITIYISIQGNNLTEKQLQIMKLEHKPIIKLSVIADNENDCLLSVTNEGEEVLQYKIDMFPFLDVWCNENTFGNIPTRVYFIPSSEKIEYDTQNEMGRITLLTEDYPTIQTISTGLHNITKEYNTLYWDFIFSYLIRVSSVDTIGEVNEDYFIFKSHDVTRVSNEYGTDIINEREYRIDNHDGTLSSKETFFAVEDSTPEQLFQYILRKIRDENLYQVDYVTDQKYLYGEYEPID